MPTQNGTKKKDRATPKRQRSAPTSPAQPQPADPASKYAPTAWGGEDNGPTDLTMPSGQVALVRRPGLQQLMVEGVLHRMDNLTALVEKKHMKKGAPQGGTDSINIGSLMADEEALATLMHTVDRVVCAVVLQPPVAMAPADVTRRVPGVVYTDSVDLQDKMFIFNFAVGGSRDLERFRRESEELVGSLAVVEPVEEGSE